MALKIAHLNYVEDKDENNSDDSEEINIVLMREEVSELQFSIVLAATFFFLSGFIFHEHLRITGLQGKREGISLTLHYHFHPLHRHLGIRCNFRS